MLAAPCAHHPPTKRSMEMMIGTTGSLVPKLAKLLKDEYDLNKGVRKQIESLSKELEYVHTVLRKVDEVPPEQLDELVKIWARQIREASYDMEDVVDTYLVRVDGTEPVDPRRFKRLRQKMYMLYSRGKARHRIAHAINAMNKKLRDVASRHERYTLDGILTNPAAPTATVDPRIFSLNRKASELVDIEGRMEELIKKLSLGDDNRVSHNKRKVVSVVGFGGLGKTTLAKAVHDKLLPEFDCGAFVQVGRNPDIKKVLMDILITLDEKYINSDMVIFDKMWLLNKLRELLQKKRYFIVIDDIWDENSWKLIGCSLPDNDYGGRVVVTTRNWVVATQACDVYKLQPLSRQNSEKLLYTRIDVGEDKCLSNESVESCAKILKKCGGVPLAIITIASLLASKPIQDWSKVCSSIGFGHDVNSDVENTRIILSFSYYDMPSYLKTCLLYMSLFPEDTIIQKYSLIWKWVAEGFIHEEGGKTLYEVGEGYFNELINRSMIQLVEFKTSEFGCRVHDMVLDLVCSLSKEEHFYTILDKDGEQEGIKSNTRRLSLTNNFTKKNPQQVNMGMEHVRTLIASNSGVVVFPSFRVLRVLALEKCKFVEGGMSNRLQHIGSLVHLRYLGLRGTQGIRELPEKIGELKLLQALDLCTTGIEELPQSVGLLTQLMFLCCDLETTRMPDWIGKLTSLQELWISPCTGLAGDEDKQAAAALLFAKELCKLRELRTLCTGTVCRLDMNFYGALLESLGNLPKIQHIEIDGAGQLPQWFRKAVTCKAGFAFPQHLRHLCTGNLVHARVPAWINSSLLNLCFLSLAVKFIEQHDMETLGRLPKLRMLTLSSLYTTILRMPNSNFGTGGYAASDVYFQKLRHLTFLGVWIEFDLHGCECTFSSSMQSFLPCLETVEFVVNMNRVRGSYLQKCCGKLGWENLPSSLQKIDSKISCIDTRAGDVEEMEAALRHAAALHPNRPVLQMKRMCESMMLSQEQEHKDICAEHFKLAFDVRMVDGNSFDFLQLMWYTCVEKFTFDLYCDNLTILEVEKVETAARYAASIHPNRPILEITRYGEDNMVPSSQHQLQLVDETMIISQGKALSRKEVLIAQIIQENPSILDTEQEIKEMLFGSSA